MVRNGDFPTGLYLSPDFMATGTLAIEMEAEPYGVSVQLRGKKIPLNVPSGHCNRDSEFSAESLLAAKDRRKRISMFKAGFDDFASEALRDFDSLRNSPPLGDQS